jgi:hypothetical protein
MENVVSFEVSIPGHGTAMCVVVKREHFATLAAVKYGEGNFCPPPNLDSWQGYVGISERTSEKFRCDLQCGIGPSDVGYKHNITFDRPTLDLDILGEEAYPRWVGFDTADYSEQYNEAVSRTVTLAMALLTERYTP